MSTSDIKFKFVAERDKKELDNIQVVVLPSPITYAALEEAAKTAFGTERIVLRYKDEDDDRVVISRQRVVDNALVMYSSKAYVRILVEIGECRAAAAEKKRNTVNEANRREILEGLNKLLNELDSHVSEDAMIKLKDVVNDAHRRLCHSVDEEDVYRLYHQTFRMFIEDVMNGQSADTPFIPLDEDNFYLVPREVIEFMNSAISAKRMERKVKETTQIEDLKKEISFLKDEERRTRALLGVGVEYLVPKMTSNASPEGFVVTRSSVWDGNWEGWQAFNDGDRWWASERNKWENSWIQIKLPARKVSNIVFLAGRRDEGYNHAPCVFRIEGSNDGSVFDRLLRVETRWYQGEEKVFAFPNETEYGYYRIFVEKIGDAAVEGSHTCLRRVCFGHY